MDIDAVYEAIAAGTDRNPDLSWTRRRLQAAALARAKDGTDEQRLGALRVAAVLGARDGIPVVAELVRDPNEQVASWAVQQAIGAHELGISALRSALDGLHPSTVRLALEHLLLWVDQGCVPTLRRLLTSSDAGVRRLAAELLGNVAGPSARMDLERMTTDPDPAVVAAANVARSMLDGTVPKSVRRPWWSEPAPAEPAPAEPGQDGVEPEAAAADPAVPTAALVPTEPSSDGPPGWVTQSRMYGGAVERGPRAAVESPAPTPAVGWDGQVSSLPAVLPDETRALVKLLGMVAEGDQPVVLARFGAADAKARRDEFSSLLMAYSGADPALGRGLCVLAAAIGGPGHVAGLRPLLRDASPWVRSAAVLALGKLAPPAGILWLTPLLDDPVVQGAAIQALAAMGHRARPDLVRDSLRRFRTSDPAVQAQVDAALGGLPT